jgi:hypothetical protein
MTMDAFVWENPLGRLAVAGRVCAAVCCSTPTRCVGSTPMLYLVRALGTSWNTGARRLLSVRLCLGPRAVKFTWLCVWAANEGPPTL